MTARTIAALVAAASVLLIAACGGGGGVTSRGPSTASTPTVDSVQTAEQQRADVLERRQAWFADQTELDPALLVFIEGEADRGRRPVGDSLRVRLFAAFGR